VRIVDGEKAKDPFPVLFAQPVRPPLAEGAMPSPSRQPWASIRNVSPLAKVI